MGVCAYPIPRTDRLDLRIDGQPKPVRHTNALDDPPALRAAKLDALVAAGYSYADLEVAHANQGAWWRKGLYPEEHPFDLMKRAIRHPQWFLRRCQPAFDRGLFVLLNPWAEGSQFDAGKRAALTVKFFEAVQHPQIAGAVWTEMDENDPDGLDTMRMITELGRVIRDKRVLLHFGTGLFCPEGIGLNEFWREGVTVHGERIPGVLTGHPHACLMLQFPKEEGGNSRDGFTTNQRIVTEIVKEHAKKRKWLPLGYGEGCHLQPAGVARRIANMTKRVFESHGLTWMGSLNG